MGSKPFYLTTNTSISGMFRTSCMGPCVEGNQGLIEGGNKCTIEPQNPLTFQGRYQFRSVRMENSSDDLLDNSRLTNLLTTTLLAMEEKQLFIHRVLENNRCLLPHTRTSSPAPLSSSSVDFYSGWHPKVLHCHWLDGPLSHLLWHCHGMCERDKMFLNIGASMIS